MQPYGSWAPPPQPKQSSGTWIGVVIGALLVLLLLGGVAIVGVVFALRARSKSIAIATAASTWSDAASPVPVTSRDPIWGDRTAPVTLVAFGDFEDPFSARLATTLDSLKSLYGPTELRVVWKHQPLAYHTNAREAAEASAGVFELKGADAFWHFEERAFANQKSLSTTSYDTWASESGVDMTQFRDGMLRHKWMPKVDDDERLAKSLGGITPFAYVNGIRVSGVQPLATWQKTIDDELSKAKLSLSSGISGDRIYVVRSTDNYGTSATPTPSTTTTYAPPTVSTAVHRVPIGTSPALGKSDALVTIVELADFQCPFCARAEATLATLRTKYGSDLRIVWKNMPLPFHVHAVPAAELALEAREEKGDVTFWAVHDALYASQSSGLDDTNLLRIAREQGVSEAKVKSAIATHKHQAIIDADQTLAKTIGATGTPTFFINGRMLSGAQPATSFEVVIDDELKKAKDRVTKGTARSKVYDEIMTSAVD